MFYITTFYFFAPQSNLEQIKQDLELKGQELDGNGLFILGAEGLNSTCSFPTLKARSEFQDWLQKYFNQPGLKFKDSQSEIKPFPRFKVKLRPEIVTLKTPELVPDSPSHRHLSPEEWDQALKDPEVAVIDTRNSYEYRIGTFQGAVNPNIDQFSDFPPFMEQQGLKKDQKILIFCTGGIRCEKGILELERQGYENVYQLDGGILNYLEQKPNSQFQGECFVFDRRVAVDQDLSPSQIYGLCPHCGDPGELKIECVICDSPMRICPKCIEKEVTQKVCSKNCAHHYRLKNGLLSAQHR